MRTSIRLVLALTMVLALSVVVGCGGGDGNGNGNGNGQGGSTVTGEIYGSLGGDFVPLGGQQAAIGNRTATSQAGTGRFTITGVPAGGFTVVVTPQAGYGVVLNPGILNGTVAAGQTVDIGRVLLGSRPPDPGL
jgi:hypothetical protein